METLQHYRTMEAFCRQRAKMEGEDETFWLTEAELLAKLSTNRNPIKVPGIASPDIAKQNAGAL
jgi:hypothetical protein